MKNTDTYDGLTKETHELCQSAELYRKNNPIHLGNGEDFKPKLSTDPDGEIKI